MKPSPTMQEIIIAIAKKYDVDLSEQGASVRLTMPHYDPLVIKVIDENLVNVAHLYELQPAKQLADPGIAFFTGYALWVPVELILSLVGYRIYASLSEDGRDITAVLLPQQMELAEFAEIWAANLVEQRWLEHAVKQNTTNRGVEAELHWPAPTTDEPDEEQLEAWLCDDICEATDGCTVEPDGTCPHGHPSWLLRFGLI